MSGLERSEIAIAKILAILAENGALRSSIKIQDIDPNSELDLKMLDILDIFRWLEIEGIVRSGGITTEYQGRQDCVLTAYGYSLLGRNLIFASKNTTIGQVAKEFSRDGRPDYSKAGDFLGGLGGGFFKSIMG